MTTPNQKSRLDISAWAAIILGLVLGFAIKRIKFGMIIGIVLGFVIVYLWQKKLGR